MREKTSLVIGTHNHLPLGFTQAAAEQSYQEAFKPLLAILYRYPAFPMTLHYSGILMEWLEEFHPEFLTLLGEMVRRGQVEVLGGGYYDPILPMIPMSDKLGQLEKMTTWLRVHFETRPRGCWIAEKVWEPSLASVLRASGIDYTFVDDGQFRIAGVAEEDLWHPFIAEDQGKIISLLPVSADLAALAARGDVEGAISFLKCLPLPAAADRGGGPVAVHMEDGLEAMGSLLRGSWLEQFIKSVEENADWLEPATPVQLLKDCPPCRRVFIPSSSSMEMMRWALPPGRRGPYSEAYRRSGGNGDGGQFVVGGQFRQFLNRYPESWLMYAKMMNTHVLVSQVRGDKYKKKAAQNELWKGQCHHAYWHGAAEGIYENALRKAVYKSLIEAEKITRATEIFAPSILSIDYDMDNSLEYLYQGSELNAYIHSLGGALFELDFLPASWNYLDTMVNHEEQAGPGVPAREQAGPGVPAREQAGPGVPAREQAGPGVPAREQAGPGVPAREQAGPGVPAREQAAPGVPAREQAGLATESSPGVEAQTAGTRTQSAGAYQRKAFIDHFFQSGCTVGDFDAGAHVEAGDFHTGMYELVDLNRALPELLMRRTGRVVSEGEPRPVSIEKRFVFRPRSIDVYYRVTNLGDGDLSTCFGMEINISLAARSAENGRLFILEEDRKKEIETGVSQIEGVQSLLVRDVRNEVSVTLSSALVYRCWSVPVETALAGEPARTVFQSHCFVPQWDLLLAAGESWENHMSVGFEKTQGA